MVVSFMVLLIAADINVWLGNKQQSKGQHVIQFSRSTMYMLHLATVWICTLYIGYNWFQKEGICTMWIICLEHSKLLDQFHESQ